MHGERSRDAINIIKYISLSAFTQPSRLTSTEDFKKIEYNYISENEDYEFSIIKKFLSPITRNKKYSAGDYTCSR